MSTLTDLSNKRDELNSSIDTYQAAVDGGVPATITSAKNTASVKGKEYANLVGNVSKTEIENDLFSNPTLLSQSKRSFVSDVMRYGSPVTHLVTMANAVGEFTSGLNTVTSTINGFWFKQDHWPLFNPTPIPNSGGSITSSNLIGSIKLGGIYLNKRIWSGLTPDSYRFVISVVGSHLPQDLFESVTVSGLGDLATVNADLFVDTYVNENHTLWSWDITQEQYDALVATGKLYIRIEDPTWFNESKLQVVPGLYTGPGGHKFHEVKNYWNVGKNFNDFPNLSVGSVVKNNVLGHTIRYLGTHTSADGLPSLTSNYFRMVLGTPNLDKNSFGAIKVPGVGTFSVSSCDDFNPAYTGDANTTLWRWNLYRGYKYNSVKYFSNMPLAPTDIEIDYRPFVPTHVLTAGQFNAGGDWNPIGLFHDATRNIGSIAPTTFNGIVVKGICPTDYPIGADPWKKHLHVRLEGSSHTQGAFDYVDIEGVGRFYSSDADAFWTDAGDNYSAWNFTISSEQLAAMPTSGNVNVQIV